MKIAVYHHDFPHGPDRLTHVADVEAPAGLSVPAALEYAYRWTQNLDGSWSWGGPLPGGMANGDHNDAVTRIAPLIEHEGKRYGLRSSMMGDVFQTEDGRRFRCAVMGFEEVAAS